MFDKLLSFDFEKIGKQLSDFVTGAQALLGRIESNQIAAAAVHAEILAKLAKVEEQQAEILGWIAEIDDAEDDEREAATEAAAAAAAAAAADATAAAAQADQSAAEAANAAADATGAEEVADPLEESTPPTGENGSDNTAGTSEEKPQERKEETGLTETEIPADSVPEKKKPAARAFIRI